MQFMIKEKSLIIDLENKILWAGNPIAKIKKGEDYLNPEIEIIADEALPLDIKKKLEI